MINIQLLIGRRIESLRKEQKISQETLALIAGLDRTYVTSVENGKRNISIINIYRLAIALKCSIYDFFNSSDFKKM